MPLSDTLGKIANGKKKDKELMSYEEWAASQPDEAGLEDADWFPGESLLPSGIFKRGIKKGVKSLGKTGAKPKKPKSDSEKLDDDLLEKYFGKSQERSLNYKGMKNTPKSGPKADYSNLGKSTNEKRDMKPLPKWKKKRQERGKPFIKNEKELDY